MQGRGENCKVDCYRRNDLDYFFAYPEDYAQAAIEWGKEGSEAAARAVRPSRSSSFTRRAKEPWTFILSGDRKPVPDLQAIFADAILKAELGPDEKDERVYDLNPMRARQFQFVYGPESGIADVAVKKLRLTVYGKKERIVLEADPSYNKHAVFDLLDKVAKGIPLTQMAVTQVGIKVTFAHNPIRVEKTRHAGLRHQLAELLFAQARRARPHHPQAVGRLRHRAEGTGQRR